MRNVITAAAILLVGASAPARAQGMGSTPPSKQATITGTVVDVSCKFGQGLSGADHKMCAEVCSDRGIPLAILGNDGKLYIPASPAMPGDAQNARLKPFAESKVKVTGKVFAAGGANAIQIASIEPAK
jgi:hypothetical protein